MTASFGSRGFILSVKQCPLGTLGNPLIVCGLSDAFRGLSKHGRDTESDAKTRQEEMHAFFSTNIPSAFPAEIDRMSLLSYYLSRQKGPPRSCDSPFPNLLRIYFVLKYASIPFAAAFPAPIARMTVAAPVTASPPANTPLLDLSLIHI